MMDANTVVGYLRNKYGVTTAEVVLEPMTRHQHLRFVYGPRQEIIEVTIPHKPDYEKLARDIDAAITKAIET